MFYHFRTLPSPCFIANTVKPTFVEKSHVEEVKRPNHSVAYCKFCREGFSSENDLFQHRKAHERCTYEDCKFNASAKVVAEHIQRIHMKSNSLVKIQDLTTPEQIEKWRAERRKRYPTSANVSLRQQAQEARFQRGEKLQDRQQRFGDFQQRNHIKNFDNRNQQKRDWNQKKNNRHQKKDHLVKTERNHQKDEKKESFQASAKLEASQIDKNNLKSTTDNKKEVKPVNNHEKVESIVKEKAALSILAMYGTDSESESEKCSVKVGESPAISDATTPKDIEMVEEQLKENVDEEAPEELPIAHTRNPLPDESDIKPAVKKQDRKRKRDNQSNRREVNRKPRTVLDYSKLRLKPSVNPFLERLLQDDIRHERNVLLQCVNYVVRNKFFDALEVATNSADPKLKVISPESDVIV